MAEKRNFTEAYLKKLEPPTEGDRYYIYDTGQPGLCIMVTAGGKRTFYIYRRLRGGKPVRVKGPAFPDAGVDDARAWARAELGKLDKGIDPNAELRARRNQITLAKVYDQYLEKHLTPHCRPATRTEWARIYKKHLEKGLARRQIADLTTREVDDLHDEITTANGPVMANRVFQFVRTMFNYARDKMGFKHLANPCDREVEQNEETERERVLDEAERHRLSTAIDNEEDAEFADYLRLMVETGQRKSTVARMKWANLDLVNGRWLIPGSATKNGKPLNLGLTAAALAVLKARKKTSEPDAENVFTRQSFRKQWQALRDRAKLTGVTMHDLRRTVGTELAHRGFNEAVIAKALGHASTRSTRVYMRIADDKAADALQAISGTILAKPAKATKKRKAG